MTGKELADWRQRANLTQTELGKLLGLSLRQVQAIEAGESPMRVAYQLAVERVAIDLAATKGRKDLVPESLMDAMRLALLPY